MSVPGKIFRRTVSIIGGIRKTRTITQKTGKVSYSIKRVKPKKPKTTRSRKKKW